MKKPPSRIKYERSHPIVSARVDEETREKLREMVESEGKSLAGFIKDFVSKKKEKLDGAYNAGYEAGAAEVGSKEYKEGYREGAAEVQNRIYEIGYERGAGEKRLWYYCAVCGEMMYIEPESNEHKEIIGYMKSRGWRHTTCAYR